MPSRSYEATQIFQVVENVKPGLSRGERRNGKRQTNGGQAEDGANAHEIHVSHDGHVGSILQQEEFQHV